MRRTMLPAGMLRAVMALVPIVGNASAQGLERVYAQANGNLLGSGPTEILYGPNQTALSTFALGQAASSALADSGGRVSCHAQSFATGLTNPISGTGSRTLQGVLVGPPGASIPTKVSHQVAYTLDIYTEFSGSAFPTSLATGSSSWTVIAGATQISGLLAETWQNGVLLLRQQNGPLVSGHVYTVKPMIQISGNLFALTGADLSFLSINVGLASLTQSDLALINFANLAGSISAGIAQLGLPSLGLLPGVDVSVGFTILCETSGYVDGSITLSGNTVTLGNSGQSQARAGNTASAQSSVEVSVTGAWIESADLPGVLQDPRFAVMSDGRLGYWNAGVLTPVGMVVDNQDGMRREFYLQTGGRPNLIPPFIEAVDVGASCVPGGVPAHVEARGNGPLAYAWQIENGAGVWRTLDTTPTTLACGGTASLASAQDADAVIGARGCAGPFRVRAVVSNLAGFTTSAPITITPCACRADLDASGGVDLDDFFAFFNCWDTFGACADMDASGEVDLLDFFAFFSSWDVGC